MKKRKIKDALKGKYHVMFYTDSQGRKRAIDREDQKHYQALQARLKNLNLVLSSLSEEMSNEGIRPAPKDAEGHVIETEQDGHIVKYQYDKNKVSEEQARQQINQYISLAVRVAEIAAMLSA
jgi:hypothetical protein